MKRGMDLPGMTGGKRALDLVLALVLGAIFILPVIGALGVMWLRQGRPFFHLSERMQTPHDAFLLFKLRTMRPDSGDFGVSGGDKAARITPMGRFLRRTRADELPQLVNIVLGEMSFVGPRPPLRRYVEARSDLYAQVLSIPTGVTGLASLVYHAHEERMLARCETPQETERTYLRRCVPRKARLDLIYRANRGLGFDLWLIWLTLGRSLRLVPRGGRLPRPPGRRG